ncbi:hypothetical protein [Aliikangiella coralliicola]|uniref:Uncharacterized protein n=1 Tax=Aliikangiella coralliicola TaxID=2592383 RepID=A0A545TW43_9GAMM|nr:hypothetical protein [Aliikangiella coralliicola]TQV81436.1 hypothetical protein FLL46_25125 [Aliikangiella coralliicola]
MAFEYGSDTLGIKNPFKFEGLVLTLRGLIVTVLGVVALLAVKDLVADGAKEAGWLSLAIGVLLLGNGVVAAGRGLFKMMRFFVGRGVPASLARNISKSEAHTRENYIAYRDKELEQMLMGRKNLTFVEPIGWLARLIHTLMPRLLFMPYPIRTAAQQLSSGLLYTLLAFLCYGLAWFSGSTGLTEISNTPVLDWLSIVLAVFLFLIWASRRSPLKRIVQVSVSGAGSKGVILMVVFSILAPVGLSYFHHNVNNLPELPLSAGTYIATMSALGLVAAAYGLILTYCRASKADPKTQVSEFRNNWQESIHPQEIFINFENIVMANRRYKEIPNRVYRDFDANLIEQGSNDKGKFSGEMIQETQPVFKEVPGTPFFKTLRLSGTLIGEILLVVAAVLFYQAIEPVTQVKSAPLAAVDALVFPMLIWVFGRIISNTAHIFWAEMHFESLIVFFQCQGTYAESKLSTGTSIHDSTRSENVVVRSSLTPWIVTSRIVTSCFAESGSNNLEFYRRILEMHKADDDLDKITGEMREFLGDRQTIASVNDKDLASASDIFQVNQETRSANSKAAIDQVKSPQIPHERAEGQLESGDSNLDEEGGLEIKD